MYNECAEEDPMMSERERHKPAAACPERSHRKRDSLTRPFIAWDGEGITFPGDVVQSYVLFGCSAGGEIMSTNRSYLTTEQCFDLLLEVERERPEAIHVGFGLRYDANMIFRDLPCAVRDRIRQTNVGRWKGYRVEYRPGKWLSVSRDGACVRLFDVFGFFQSSFVVAVEKYLGNTPETQRIVAGKGARKTFVFEELASMIRPYWLAELDLLVRLMDSLRSDLASAGMYLSSWHGPGAVASVVFRRRRVTEHRGVTPLPVIRASQYAYAGGRFELFGAGHYDGPVYQYDLNSAYPAAIARLPSLARGRWERVEKFEPGTFGVWRILYSDPRPGWEYRPHPLFSRGKGGQVTYPDLVLGWYWTPEATPCADYVRGGYVWRPDVEEVPFGFVAEMYEQRRQWKAEGNSAERAYKLALNSLYGKMAQRLGWEEGGKIPPWHQLEWAGYVTSYTRAKIWEAVQQCPRAIIAVETDAVFSTAPLSLTITDELGDWSEDAYDWVTYIQNGVYWAGQDGAVIDRYRGFDKGSLDHGAVMQSLRAGTEVSGRTTRFVGMGIAATTKATWCSWETNARALRFGGGGKRSHAPRVCAPCQSGAGLAEGLHPLVLAMSAGRSLPHSLPWLAGAESELRAIDAREEW